LAIAIPFQSMPHRLLLYGVLAGVSLARAADTLRAGAPNNAVVVERVHEEMRPLSPDVACLLRK
jgi:hypothetical protein